MVVARCSRQSAFTASDRGSGAQSQSALDVIGRDPGKAALLAGWRQNGARYLAGLLLACLQLFGWLRGGAVSQIPCDLEVNLLDSSYPTARASRGEAGNCAAQRSHKPTSTGASRCVTRPSPSAFHANRSGLGCGRTLASRLTISLSRPNSRRLDCADGYH